MSKIKRVPQHIDMCQQYPKSADFKSRKPPLKHADCRQCVSLMLGDNPRFCNHTFKKKKKCCPLLSDQANTVYSPIQRGKDRNQRGGEENEGGKNQLISISRLGDHASSLADKARSLQTYRTENSLKLKEECLSLQDHPIYTLNTV